MPIGSYAAVPSLVQRLLERRPGSVLDLGMGFGGAGVIVRQWLDHGVRPWKTFLAGVEVWPEYRTSVWDLYNVVYAQRIENFLAANRKRFDCVLLCDVLEHFDKAAGRTILAAVKRHVADDGQLLITTPARFFHQGAVYGNEHERHRSHWPASELTELGFRTCLVGEPSFYCGECLFAQWQP